MGEGCRDCQKRTHNEGGGLFEDEVWSLNDVCLDAECYRGKWRGLIEEALKEAAEKYGPGLKTDSKIYFSSLFRDGVLPRLYKKADQVELLGARFAVLKDKEYSIGEETKRKTKCCWEAEQGFNGIEVRRVGYSGKEEKPRGKTGGDESSYGAEILAVAGEAGLDAGELGRKVMKEEKGWKFESDINKACKKRLFERALKEKPAVNYAGHFLASYLYGINDSGDFTDPEDAELLRKTAGVSRIGDLKLSPKAQGLFMFLCYFDYNHCPEPESNPEFYGIDKETLEKERYEATLEVIRKVAGIAEEPEGPDALADGDDYPWEEDGGREEA
jgi:hypothetical protein